ncbi:helix-turn-helix domain-containing protein [Halalkalicoccus jeotgali]|uniref:HTH bat-type domain-containing protein n=1 Tax=Halalkalicoccus jeotgali (strain DSM 18796 / CECT 7217 / JCM 14584 / KCTC 4019 / B3) TaxID=795797 RepID=D8JBJ3_HALJB|nr:helix-turn-helix domain-containing protein [Halalkalicoccus jeotgali]ADJ16646.1 hypothetical protein HacjB3_16471 [Halalkalicoccus jeotgali B3]ELY39090.1 hypothetical protein C497_06259 [Halalkalicoccus jeotgali B3]
MSSTDTLFVALEKSYFTVPREITSKELGEQLGGSDQEVTERIRRGTTNILTHILMSPEDD